MTHQQKQMKAELIEAADIMEDIQETMFVNPVFSQQAPPQAPDASNEMNFQSAIPVLESNMELTITFDRAMNELTIPNLQQNV